IVQSVSKLRHGRQSVSIDGAVGALIRSVKTGNRYIAEAADLKIRLGRRDILGTPTILLIRSAAANPASRCGGIGAAGRGGWGDLAEQDVGAEIGGHGEIT